MSAPPKMRSAIDSRPPSFSLWRRRARRRPRSHVGSGRKPPLRTGLPRAYNAAASLVLVLARNDRRIRLGLQRLSPKTQFVKPAVRPSATRIHGIAQRTAMRLRARASAQSRRGYRSRNRIEDTQVGTCTGLLIRQRHQSWKRYGKSNVDNVSLRLSTKLACGRRSTD